MIAMNPRLVVPDSGMREAFLRMFADYQAFGERDWCDAAALATTDFTAYVSEIRGEADGLGISSDWAPTSHFWMEAGDDLIGTLRIRHFLTPAVEARAGHLGYDIAPSFRGRGLGHAILDLGLIESVNLGIADVLAICSAGNSPSRRIIEKRGGSIEKIADGEIWYWLRGDGQIGGLNVRSPDLCAKPSP